VPAFSILDEMKEILYLFYRFLIQVAENDDKKQDCDFDCCSTDLCTGTDI
jgi:hypothetical protein